ncbi:FG-GAP repeat protein [Synechocystis sp. FACHB-383]|uniref:Calx-beta domain-containing protein n=1 Tax=Synechocystis sp. FACHB-383 TaxID=2692864 RepID=UPI0016823A78|nr:Calx-beta domain-containing protein [Synechocystis sp. FACHB-383]MBD2651916.1 FG-GAP repeat protein [Synechocystis sp. FACHB-383]
MAINFSNRLSSVTTDSAGVTHIVWVEEATLFHGTYDDNSATWINQTAIANVGSQKIVSLNLIANDKLIDDSVSATELPGLAVVYQQGSENESNIFYTAAQYNAAGKTQWLDKPQALTADQVGDLEPRAIAKDDDTVFVVGQKVDTENAQNQGIREDTDLYYQSFRVNSSQFTTTPSSPASSGKGKLAGNGSGYSGQNSAVAASYSVLSDSEAEFLAKKAFNGQGLNWNASSGFSDSLLKFIIAKSENAKVKKAVENGFGGVSVNIALQGSSGDNPTWSLFGGGVSTDGKLLLNAVAAVSFAKATKKKTSLQQKKTTEAQNNEFDFSIVLSSLYSFGNTQGSSGQYPLELETGGFALSFGFTFPIVGANFGENKINLFNLNAFIDAGIALQWQLKPKDPDTYRNILFPFIDSNSNEKGLLIADSFGTAIPGFSQVVALEAILSNLISAFESIDDNGPLSLESLLIGIPIEGGVELIVDIPFIFKLTGSVGIFLDGTFLIKGSSDFPKDTFTLGLPYSLEVQALGFLNAKISGFPTWTWPESSSQSLTINPLLTLSASETEPTVQGSLLTIPFATPLSPNLSLNPEDFTVQVTNANKSVSTVPVFDVIVQENAVILRLERSIPYATLNDQPLTDNITVSYSGNQLNDFTKSTVINNSAQTLVYTYDPTSGNGNNYTNTNQQITIAFNTPLDTNVIPDASQFVVTTSDGTTINLIAPNQNGQQPVYVNKNSVILTLAQTIPQEENYTVKYTEIQGESNNLQTPSNQDIASFTIDSSSPSTTAGDINNTFISAGSINQVISKVDNDFSQDSPPALALTSEGDILLSWGSDAPNLLPISALAQGSNIYLTFGENLANNQGNYLNPEADQFVVIIDGITQSLNQNELPNVEGNTLVLTLAQPILGNATTISVSYNLVTSDGSNSSNLVYIDPTGTTFWLEKFADLSVDLINDVSAPTILDLDVNGNIYNGYGSNQTIVIAFDQELSFTSENDQLPSNDFNVLVNGKAVGVVQAIINETSVVLTLDNSLQIGQGNLVSVAYTSDLDNPLKGINNQVVASFSTSNILTTPTNSGTVIKTAFSPFGDSGISEITTIPGTSGLNFNVASTLYTYTDSTTNQTNQINVLAWVQVDNDDLTIQQIPGQNYSSEQAEKINAAISQSDIYYSILGPDNQWSLAQPIAAVQTGQDQKVTLGAGPNGELLAAWLNTQQESNGDTSTTIYWSSFNGTSWTTPQTLLSEISPNAFTELNISTINGQPAIFWTESQPASYSELVVEQDPIVYLRLGELSGTTAINEGQSGPTINGNYSGNFTLNQIGALEDITNNTGDPNPAVLFNGGGVTLDAAIPVSIQGFSVEFWFKLPSINAIPNLVSMADVFLFTVNDTQLKFSLDNTGNSTIATTPPLNTDTWYYVVGTYDGSQDILSLYLNGELVGSLDNVNFSNLPQSGTLAVVGQEGSVYVDEVAFYNSVLSYVPSSTGLTASNVTDFTGNQFLDGALGTNEIGDRFNAQYVDPVPAGPEAYYSVWNPTTNSWQLSGQIEPIPTIVPTILSDANFPIWDIVAATESPKGKEIFPNGKADSIFQINLTNQQGQEITGIKIAVPGTNLLWGVGQNGDGNAIGGFQVGVILGETVPNNGQLTFADGTILLNSLDPALSGLNHRVMGETETLNLFIDETGNTFSATPTVTVYFKDGGSVTPQVSSIRNQGGTVPAKGINDLGTEVLGIATVTEANDASLANIDSGFVINTNNAAIAAELASGFKADGSLAYVAVGNRGYTDSAGNLVSGGTIQILLADGSVLNGTESNSLTTTDLSGNPGGVLITGIADSGVVNGGVSMSLATGDINGDGIDDLVIGDANANGGDGVIYVIYGSYLTSNPGSTIDVGSLTSAMGYVINPAISSAQAGFSVVMGNFDGDSSHTRNDIAFSAPGVGNGGAVYIAYNGSTSFTEVYQGTSLNQVGERAGFSLGASHYLPGNPTTFTGSSTSDDLFIGAPAYQVEVNNQWKGKGGLPSGSQSLYPDSAQIAVGAVHVFSTSSQGLTPWGTYTGPNIPAPNGVATNYLAGAAIASGDFTDLDGDGQQDLVISATGINANAGAVYVIQGHQPSSSSTSPQALSTVSNLIINGSLANGQAGTVVTVPGDLNGDGYQDFLITAPQVSNGTGQSYLLFGPLDLSQVGTIFDLGATSQDKTFLLNGSLPYQLAGTAATGLGNITGKTGSNGKVDSLLLTAPNAQQAYAVYGQPYLEDDGSIKLANIASNNGFVIDGNSFSTFKVANPEIFDQTTNVMPSLVSYQGKLYMAYKGDGSGQDIYITSSSDGGKTWSNAIVAIKNATNFSPSLAVYNDVLYLAYTGLDPQLNILYSTDGGQWSSQSVIGQTSSNAPTLVTYQDKLLALFISNDPSSRILYIYSDDPQSSNSWSGLFEVTYDNGSAPQTSPNAVSATVLNDTLYLAYQTGTKSGPGNGIDITSTTGTDLNNLSWSLASVPGINTSQTPGLTTDGTTIYLTSTQSRVDEDQLIYLSTSTNGTVWTTSKISGTSNYASSPVIVNNQLYLVNSTANNGYQVLETSLPPFSISNNGSIVRMLGDINGDGFADVYSGGDNAGVIIFGDSTKDLLTAASGNDALTINIQSADIQDVVDIGDYNGDGLSDFGIIDSNNNFYLLLGNIDFGNQKQITLVADANSSLQLAGISNAFAIADYNNDGYSDILFSASDGKNLISLGNQLGKLTNFDSTNLPPTAITSATGIDIIDINGDGDRELAVNIPSNSFSLYSSSGLSPISVALPTVGGLLRDPNASDLQDIGDVNGDGIDDFGYILTAFVENNKPKLNFVAIYYGSLSGLNSNSQPDILLSTIDINTDTSLPAQLTSFAPAGDVNGDGFDDLWIGVPGTNQQQGTGYVVFGAALSANNGKFLTLKNLTPEQGFSVTGLPNSLAGVSLGGGGDVNGDGFDDLIIGAPGNNDNLSFVLFGSDFNQTVNQTGTIGDDVMLGTPTGESFVAGQGDDQIYTNGGLDVVYAGPGDDFVSVADTYFRRLDGGTGLDVLELQGYNGQNWDITTLAPGVRLKNFEVISILDYGANTLTLNALTVTNLSSNNTVVVLMDSVDSLVLSSDFSAAGTTYQYGDKYYQYTSDLSAATVLVNQAKAPTYTAVSTNIPAPILPTSNTEINNGLLSDLTINSQNKVPVSNPNAPTKLLVSNPKISEAIGEVDFVIERTGDLDKYVLVSYLTQDGDGKAGNRYLPVAGQLIFNPGETSKKVTVQIPNDDIYTGDRQFGLLVSLLEEGFQGENWGETFSFVGDAHGSQIRHWNYLAGELDNALTKGVINFSTKVEDGKAQVNLDIEDLAEFNDFFNYNPITENYESLMLDNVTGAKFSYLDGENSPHGVELKLIDGDRGDADGVSNGLVETKGYLGRVIPGLISNDNRIFWAPTNADGQVQLRLISSPDQNYELGWVAVDNVDGSIDGLLPNDPGYEVAALARKQIIFNNQTDASPQALTRSLAQQSFTDIDNLIETESQFFGDFSNSNLEANRYYILYSQQGNETTFSIDIAPVIETDSRGYHQLNFAGITAEIGSKTLLAPGISGQSVTAEVSISRAGAYDNTIALYQVDSLTGGLDVNGDRQIDLKPGDTGYLQAALSRAQNPLTGVSLTPPDSFFGTTKQTINLLGNNMYGMVIIPNATIEEVLNQNPSNDPNLGPAALFSFNEANPGGISQMSRLGSNLFGFEDIVGGGDQDYNDLILQFDFLPT